MAQQASSSPALAPQDLFGARAQASRHLILLLSLFAGSGCAALIYEIVWFQLLQLAIGSSAVSLGVLLGIYMGGMCLGSLALPKWISETRNPLRVYAGLECGIGTHAILVLFAVPYLDQIYAAMAAHGSQGIALRAALAGICLLPPTLLMGASLPARLRYARGDVRGRGDQFRSGIDQSPGGWKAAGKRPESAPPEDSQKFPCLPGVHRDRAFGHDRAWRGSSLDAPALGDDRRHRLHLFHHSGGVSDWPGNGKCDWQRSRPKAAAHGARALSIAAGRGDILDRLLAVLFSSLLAH